MDDFLVTSGGAIKSLSDTGKVGGYLVLFDIVDLDQEYFTKAGSDFWLHGKSLLPLIYDHGRDKTLRKRKLTHVYHDTQDKGLWIEGKLPLGDGPEIERIWEAVKRDELGLSSGSSSHLVEGVKRPHGTELTTWPITEASLALRPAQPQSRAIALKSLPVSDFDLFADHRPSPEERAREIYVDLLKSRHERVMREFERSQHADAKAEEFDYYNALAQLEIEKCELRKLQLKKT